MTKNNVSLDEIERLKTLPYLTAEEMAVLQRVAASTVRRWGYSGVIPCIKIGGSVRFINKLQVAN